MRAALWPQALDEHPSAIDAFLSGQSKVIDEALVCETDRGALVGFLELRVRNYAEGTDSLAVPYVEGWYVDPEYRLQGAGALLMRHAERWALESGYAELASDTEIGNVDSIAAHRALGFEVTDKVVCFLKKIEERGMPLLFSYGTLQQQDVQLSLFGRSLRGQPDELVGFEQARFAIEDPKVVAASGKTHHAIVKFNGLKESRVKGTVFEVSDRELARADQYEPAGYKRVMALLASGKQAWVYADARFSPQSGTTSFMEE